MVWHGMRASERASDCAVVQSLFWLVHAADARGLLAPVLVRALRRLLVAVQLLLLRHALFCVFVRDVALMELFIVVRALYG